MTPLSERGTLLVPVELRIPPRLTLGVVELVRKREFHLTVLGSSRGALLRAAALEAPALAGRVASVAAGFAWPVAVGDERIHLAERKDEGELQTVIAIADAPLDAFYAALRDLVAGDGRAAHRALAASFASPPPPHVTLYTTDPEGLRGIGLATRAELDDALARGLDTPGPEIRARRIAVARGLT